MLSWRDTAVSINKRIHVTRMGGVAAQPLLYSVTKSGVRLGMPTLTKRTKANLVAIPVPRRLATFVFGPTRKPSIFACSRNVPSD